MVAWLAYLPEGYVWPPKGEPVSVMTPVGCICPPGAEAGCRGERCPRQPSPQAEVKPILGREDEVTEAMRSIGLEAAGYNWAVRRIVRSFLDAGVRPEQIVGLFHPSLFKPKMVEPTGCADDCTHPPRRHL